MVYYMALNTHTHRVLSQMLPGMMYAYESFEANKMKWVELSKEGGEVK